MTWCDDIQKLCFTFFFFSPSYIYVDVFICFICNIPVMGEKNGASFLIYTSASFQCLLFLPNECFWDAIMNFLRLILVDLIPFIAACFFWIPG